MRRVLILLGLATVLATVLALPASAATANFAAVMQLDFVGKSPAKPCPLDPTTTCDVGHIAGYGQVVQEFTFVSGVEVDGCFETTGDVLWTLVADPVSTFMTHEVYTECTPGASADAPGNRLHSFGNPFQGEGTFVISAGTGVFAGASGSGALFTRGAGDSYILRYAGTITLP
jgi:hypothetical protein